MKNKIDKLKDIVKNNFADSLLLYSKHPNHKWLLETKLDNSIIIIKRTGKPIIIKSSLENFDSDNFKIVDIKNRKNYLTNLIKNCGKVTCVDFSRFTLIQKKVLKRVKLIDVRKELSALRKIKDKKELDNIKKACKHTTKCFNLLVKQIKKFKHEQDIINFIKHYALENNLELAFDTIAASGINATVPHHSHPSKLKKGFCVIDFGFDYKGYKSDMTRTVYLGKPTKVEKEIYDLVVSIQERLIPLAIDNTQAKELDIAARIMFGQYKKYFTHSLGHGLGLEIHEAPYLRSESKNVLRENQVITIEPGLYDKTKKIGIRIEDSLIVKKGKPIVLTKDATKKLIEIK